MSGIHNPFGNNIENPDKNIELSESIQNVLDRDLHIEDDEEYKQEAITSSDSKKVSEDAFVRTMRVAVENLKEGTSPKIHSLYGTLMRILDRESMKDHPDATVFKKSIKDLEELDDDYKIKVREGYWDDVE